MLNASFRAPVRCIGCAAFGRFEAERRQSPGHGIPAGSAPGDRRAPPPAPPPREARSAPLLDGNRIYGYS